MSPRAFWGADLDIIVFILNKVVVVGLVIGSVYALGAIGVTLIAGILRFSHFAHGDVMTMGAFISFILASFLAGWGIHLPITNGILVLPISMVLTAIILYLFDLWFYRPLRRRGARPNARKRWRNGAIYLELFSVFNNFLGSFADFHFDKLAATLERRVRTQGLLAEVYTAPGANSGGFRLCS